MKMKGINYFGRLLLFSLLIGTIPVMIQGVFSYYKASDMIEDEVIHGKRLLLQQTQMRVEQVLKSVDSTMMHFTNTPIMAEAMHSSFTPNDFQTVYNLSSYLNSLQIMQYGVQNIYLLNLLNGWLYQNGGVYRLEKADESRFYEQYARFSRSSEWVADRGFVFESESLPTNNMLLVQKIPVRTLKPAGLLITKLPARELNALLSNDRQGQFMILNENGETVAFSGEGEFGRDLSATPLVKEIRGIDQQEGYITSVENGNKVGVSFLKSTYNGWLYLSVVSLQEITKDSRSIGYITLMTCSSILLLTLAISLMGTRKMYIPIRHIYNDLIGAVPQKSRFGDELEAIGDRIHTMMKSQMRLAGQIQGQLRQLKMFYLQKLLRGELKEPEAREKSDVYGFSSRWKQLVVLIVQIDDLEGTRFSDNDRDLLLFSINNIVSELIPQERMFDSVLIGQAAATVVCHESDAEDVLKSYVYSIAETIQNTVHRYLDIKVSVGIGRPCRLLSDIANSYQEAVDALKYRICLGHGAVLYLEDVEPGLSADTFNYPRDSELEITEALKAGDADRTVELLHAFMGRLHAEPFVHREYQFALVRLLVSMLKIAQDYHMPLWQRIEHDLSLYDQLFELHSVDEIISFFSRTIIVPLSEMIENRRDSQYRKISDEVMRMIHEEYDTDLSLELCAQRLNVHTSYINRVLRRELDLSFGDYLSRYRLSIAKRWLLETDMKIADIAEKLRYNNPQNFIRYFRKWEGVTPGQYRKDRQPAPK